MAKKSKKSEKKDGAVGVEELEIKDMEVIGSGSVDDLPEELRQMLSQKSPAPPKLPKAEEAEEAEEAEVFEEVEHDPEDLEEQSKVAEKAEKSIADIVGVSSHMLDLLQTVQGFKDRKDERMILAYRRKIRYRCFRIREGGRIADAHDMGLKDHIEQQFEQGMTWANFTFEWDIAPMAPLMVIPRTIINNEWRASGGQFKNDKKYPPAFTNQK